MAARTVLAALLLATAIGGPSVAQTFAVTARGETQPVATATGDAADDPAIWRNPRRPAASLIVGTDKKAGLYVYGLDGRVRHFEPAGRVNNVDLVDLGRRGILVAASDRGDPATALLRLYRLDPASGKLIRAGSAPGGTGEAYGICLLKRGKAVHAFSVLKDGTIHQVRLDPSGTDWTGTIVRSWKLQTQAEGCVADPRTNILYVGEEDRGIWAFDLAAGSTGTGRLVGPADGAQLVADTEGLALAPRGRTGGYLIASSQGDNAYALYRLPTMAPAGRFRIVAGAVGGTEETDGIAMAPGRFGPLYPQGLFVAQDGHNAPAAQNFKLVSWRDIMRASAKAPAR